MKNNELILKAVNEIDIYDLKPEQIINMKEILVKKTDIKELQKQFNTTIMDLANVGKPRFNVDAKIIAMDDQARLTLIHQLTYYFDLYIRDIHNFKKNKSNCNDNYEYIFNFISNSKNLFNNIVKYGEFKLEESKKANKQLDEYKKKLLKGCD